MTLHLRCRFDNDHETFSNAVLLRQHYDSAHPGMHTPGGKTVRGTCSECGESLAQGSFRNHRLKMHPSRPDASWTEEGVAPRPRRRPVAPAQVMAPAIVEPVQAPVEPAVTPRERLNGTDVIRDADDIVIPAITVLAMPGNVVPVEHLAALFVWRDQTVAMLAAVRGETQ